VPGMLDEELKMQPTREAETMEASRSVFMCGLTFELTPTTEAGRLARVVQHKPARHAGKLARRSGSGAERGVRLLCRQVGLLLNYWGKCCSRSD
jgi:hypothetical protein